MLTDGREETVCSKVGVRLTREEQRASAEA